MDGQVGVPLPHNPGSYDPQATDRLSSVSLATNALARAAGHSMIPQMDARHMSTDMFLPTNHYSIDPRLGGQADYPGGFARPALIHSSSYMQKQPLHLDTDPNLATTPMLHQHLITPVQPTEQTLAGLHGDAQARRPPAPPSSTGTSLPPVRDLIEVAHQGNEAQASLSRRTSSYGSFGNDAMTPSRRTSSQSVPQSPMNFGNVVYPSPTVASHTGHRRQESYPGAGPTDPVSSTFNPRRVPNRRIPPFPTMLGSTHSANSSANNSASSVPSLSSIPSLTSVGSFETTVTTPQLSSTSGTPDTPGTQQPILETGNAAAHPLYPTVPMSGNYKCTFEGCKAAPFTTQYLLTYGTAFLLYRCNADPYSSHMNVHSSERPHYCPVEGCERAIGGKGFKRKNEMKRHGLVHNSPGYVCPYCPDREHRYPRPDNLQR